jgi:hypothetical protein
MVVGLAVGAKEIVKNSEKVVAKLVAGRDNRRSCR